jgi:hypothetical protein
MDYTKLLEYCETDAQVTAVEAYIKHGSCKKAAEALGRQRRGFEQIIKRVKVQAGGRGYAPEYGINRPGPDGFTLGSFSDMQVNELGKPIWYKFTEDKARQLAIIKETVAAMKDEIIPIQVPKAEKIKRSKDLIPWFQIGDAHIGMLAHKYEVGHNFDLKIAEAELCKAFQMAIDESPATERCVINDLGDFQHYDNIAGVTERSRNQLDIDGRFGKMVRVSSRIMQYIILSCLKKFQYVDVIINKGNHNDTGAIWMAELMRCRFQDKRVHILDNDCEFIPYRMGNTFVVTSHGQNCKPAKMAETASAHFRHDFSESSFVYLDTGHIHHKQKAIEFAGCLWESYNTMAPTDKHAHDHGYESRSCLAVVYRSKIYGQRGSNVISAEMVKDLLDNVPAGTESKKRREVYTV